MKRMKVSTGCGLVLVLLGALAPFVIYPTTLMQLMCYILLATSVAFLANYGGMLSFGHALFYGGGAYAVGWILVAFPVDGVLAIAFGIFVATLLGALCGIIATRSRAIYFAMVTLGLAQVGYFIVSKSHFSGGEDGLRAFGRPLLFGLISTADDTLWYYIVFGITVLTLLGMRRIGLSPYGRVLAGIRDSERKVTALGYTIWHYRLLALMISAAVGGLAGSLKAISFQLVTLNDMNWTTSGDALLIGIIGGLYSLFGPIIGGIIYIIITYLLVGAQSWILLLKGVLFVFIVLTMQRGVVAEIEKITSWFVKRKSRVEGKEVY